MSVTSSERDYERLLVCVEMFIRRVHADGDAEIRLEDIPALLEAIACAFDEYRDRAAEAVRAVNDLLMLVRRSEAVLRNAERIAATVGVKPNVLRGIDSNGVKGER